MLSRYYLRYGTLNEAQWAAAVAYLRQAFRHGDRELITAEMRNVGLAAWITSNHFPFGMHVRNLLRHAGYTEDKLGITDLDGAWGHLLAEAFGVPISEDGSTDT